MHKGRCCYGNIEPELAHCRTTQVGAVIPGTDVDMYYCLNENGDCRYARSFGYDYVCKHADNHAFVLEGESRAADPQKKREQA